MPRPTKEMAKEFCRDFLGTCKKPNAYYSVREIAKIMNIDYDKARDFCVVANVNGYMCKDPYKLPAYANFNTLYKVKHVQN